MKKLVKHISIFMLVFAMILTATTPVAVEAATVKPAKVKIKSVTRNLDKSTITIKFKSVKKATGYQVAYKKSTAKKYTIKTTKKTSKTISVSNTATYKIKVRAYRKVNGKKYYGKWSAVKTVKKHTHSWTPVYKTVVDKEAYDEKVPTGEYYTKREMHKYALATIDVGITGLDNIQYYKNNKYIDITDWTQEQRAACIKEYNLMSLSSFYTDYLEVPNYDNPIYETVHYDAVTHQEIDHYECSCGRTKAVKSNCTHNYEPVYRTVLIEAAHDEITWVEDFPNTYTRVICTTEASFKAYNNENYTGYYSDSYKIDVTDWTDEQKRQYEQSHNFPTGMLDRDLYEAKYNTAGCQTITTSRKYTTTHYDAVTQQKIIYYKCSKCGKTKPE